MDSIQKTDKTQDTQLNSGIEPQNREHHHQLNKIKVEEQRKSSCAHQFKNGDHHKDENLKTTHEEMVGEKAISTTTNDGREERETEEENGRERLKRHRRDVAGHVWIPDMWGQEKFLKDWSDCSAFDACLVPQGILLARSSLIEEGRRSHSGRLRVENS